MQTLHERNVGELKNGECNCVAQWRKLVAHRMCQKHGRMEDFSDYTITVVTPVRSYTMTQRQGAPADSNSFLGV